jgi:pimeloyl-ACP methyl ester carboxylesterase
MPLSSHVEHRLTPRLGAPLAALLAAMALLTMLHPGDAVADTHARPTIVFVHGAFADASGFGAVTSRLQHRGYTVVSPADPLRGLASDAGYVASVMKTIDGPIVLVGHSYGGAVISEAANEVANVKALVYLNAYALDEGESALGIAQRFPGGKIAAALRMRPFPLADGTEGTDLYIDPASFRSVFAGDVPARTAARMASAQRPVTLAAFQEGSTAPAWKTVPSWYLIGRDDQAIDPAAQRFMARRAHAHTVAIDSSHASYVAHPAKVAALIVRAARARG